MNFFTESKQYIIDEFKNNDWYNLVGVIIGFIFSAFMWKLAFDDGGWFFFYLAAGLFGFAYYIHGHFINFSIIYWLMMIPVLITFINDRTNTVQDALIGWTALTVVFYFSSCFVWWFFITFGKNVNAAANVFASVIGKGLPPSSELVNTLKYLADGESSNAVKTNRLFFKDGQTELFGVTDADIQDLEKMGWRLVGGQGLKTE